jgi:hypothetical protein
MRKHKAPPTHANDRESTVELPTEEPDTNREIDAEEPENELGPEELFDLAASLDGARVHVAKFNKRSGDFAMIGVLQAPATWETIAHRWGGGSYRWTARVNGKWHSTGRFEISEEEFPAELDNDRKNGLTEDDDRTKMLIDRLERMERRLAEAPAPQSGLDLEKIVSVIGQVLQVVKGSGGVGADMASILEAVKLGKELAGEGGERGLVDVAAEVIPELLRNMRERSQPRVVPQATAAPRPTPTPPTGEDVERAYLIGRLRKVVDLGMQGADPEAAAQMAEQDIPPAILEGLTMLPPEALLKRIGEMVPAARDWTQTPAALQWTQGFLSAMKEQEGGEEA